MSDTVANKERRINAPHQFLGLWVLKKRVHFIPSFLSRKGRQKVLKLMKLVMAWHSPRLATRPSVSARLVQNVLGLQEILHSHGFVQFFPQLRPHGRADPGK